MPEDVTEPRFGTCLWLYLDEPISPRHFADIKEAVFDTVEVAANFREHMRRTKKEIQLIQSATSNYEPAIASVHLGFDVPSGM